MQARDKIGKTAVDLLAKDDNPVVAYELTEEVMHKEFLKELELCIDRHTKIFKNYPFYVVCGFRSVRYLHNVKRMQFWGRMTCPLPTEDQTVYYVDPRNGFHELMWAIPDREACKYIVGNCLQLPAEEKQLLQTVLDYQDGTLDRLALSRDKILIELGIDPSSTDFFNKKGDVVHDT